MKESLDIICYISNDEKGMYYEFGDVHYAVMYMNSKAKSEKIE